MVLPFKASFSLRQILAASFAFVTCIGGLCIFLIGEYQKQIETEETEKLAVQRSAHLFAQAIEHKLDSVGSDLSLAAQNSLLTDFNASAAKTEFLARWQKLKPQYTDILFADRTGRVIATASGKNIAANVARSSWFDGALTTITLGDASEHVRAGVEMASNMIAAGPVPSHLERPAAGVLAIQLKPDWLATIVANLQPAIEKQTFFGLMNANGQILFSTRTSDRLIRSSESIAVSVPIGDSDTGGIGWLATSYHFKTTVPLLEDARQTLPLLSFPVLLAALFGWLAGRMISKELRPKQSDDLATSHSTAITEIAALLENRKQDVEKSRLQEQSFADFRASLLRSRHRLNAVEVMTGWNNWTVELGRGEVTWIDLHPGAMGEPAEKSMPLDQLLDRIEEADRGKFLDGLAAAANSDIIQELFLHTLPDEEHVEKGLLAIRLMRCEEGVTSKTLHVLSCDLGSSKKLSEHHLQKLGSVRLASGNRQLELTRQLAYGIAHDIDDVLTIIKTATEMLALNINQKVEIETVLRGVKRASGLTRRQTEYYSHDIYDAGFISKTTEVFDDIIDHLRRVMKPSQSLIVTTEIDLPGLACSERQLEFCLSTLTLETKHLLDKDDATIMVSLDRDAAKPEYCRLIFTAPLDLTNQSATFSSINVLMTAIGGSMEIQKSVDETSVALYLPVKPSKTDTPPAKEKQALTILLVEDDAVLRSVIHRALESLGHIVIETASGTQALKLLDEQANFEILLAGEANAFMRGRELAIEVKKKHPLVRIVLFGPKHELSQQSPELESLCQPFGLSELIAAFGSTGQKLAS